ncbi:MAG: anhydro-N-acetylmuramic acid kinase [Cytophagales bacterium]|nr:MAG: anhydro-N-acetylmuramic acid kinase [Cytophagales bacterium]TAF59794.1 MAG: anhydro-N-acetylmuramic acid kinase [Cytophagales bacterium]
MNHFHVLGLMSGTSLDGLDLAYCTFTKQNDQWFYEIVEAETAEYDPPEQDRLYNAMTASGWDLVRLHKDFGHYMGRCVEQFCKKYNLKPYFVASHGHTVFHRTDLGITFQIGSPADIAAQSGLPVVADFRSLDVAMGGQGAPLVPTGDRLLFSEFDYCLNLGGIANISYEENQQRLAFDIAPANILLNRLARRRGMAYDRDGLLAREGEVHATLLEQLNKLDFYKEAAPKSLGREWIDSLVWPILEHSGLKEEDLLATVARHIAQQIGAVIKKESPSKLLATGGGVYHAVLMENLAREVPQCQIVVPNSKIIAFKEALIFAFLGVLRWTGQPNSLASVTGAPLDLCGGAIYLPPRH